MDVKWLGIIALIIFLIPANSAHYFSSFNLNENILNQGGKTLYVGGSGDGNYTSIQAAIDDAMPGDTIFVYSGTYYEHIKVNKSLKIIGNNRENTIIDAKKKGNAVVIKAANVLFKSFTVRNGGKNFDERNAGIKLNGENITIDNCNVYNCNDGIDAYGSGIIISDCSINKNEWVGIGISGFNLTVERCVMHYNKCYGVAIGSSIFHGISSFIHIKDCDIAYSRNEKWIAAGIFASGIFIKIEHCNIHDNLGGISGEWIAFSSINNCRIYDNNYGIGLSFSAFMNIKGCNIENNGVMLFSSFFNFFHGNNFYSKNISFMDSSFNLWLRNYWNGWFVPIPKPIYGILISFAWNDRIISIPWLEFDFMPRLFPHNF